MFDRIEARDRDPDEEAHQYTRTIHWLTSFFQDYIKFPNIVVLR